MKVIFFGSDEISLPFLEYLSENEEVICVITQPDKPKSRGLKPSPTPVKEYATSKNIKVLDPINLNDIVNVVKELNLDIGIIVAYGKRIPKEIFSKPKYGTINLHFSLLPKYRGPAPIEFCLLNNEEKTGVTIIEVSEEIDAGKILSQKEVKIDETDDFFSLRKKLIQSGISLLSETLEKIKSSKIEKIEQIGTPSYTRLLKKEDGKINWSKNSLEIHNHIRAFKKWPGAYSIIQTKSKKIYLKVTETEISSCEMPSLFMENGVITRIIKHIGFAVKTNDGEIIIKKLKPEGKKEMTAWEFIQGYHIMPGYRFLF